MLEIKRILFPIDFTENSSKILPYVLSIAEKYDATIYLLHVVEDFCEWGGFYVPHLPIASYHTEALKGAEKMLDTVCDEQLQGCVSFQRVLVCGDPVAEILKAIEEKKIDLLVMGHMAARDWNMSSSGA